MNCKKNIACIVVVYNKNCADSQTCKTLANTKDVNIIILDNSTEDYDNKAYCEALDWVYINNNGNVGLSRAYNNGIDYLQSIGFGGLICLFDDDSEFDVKYFDCVCACMSEDNGADIILPIIYAGETIISPCKIYEDMRTDVFTSKESALAYNGNDITGINSAMAIESRVFNSYRYDENIFLDGIDHKFMADMKKAGRKIAVVDYVMHQNFSGNEKPSMQSALNRFCIYAKDMKYIMANNVGGYRKLMLRRMLKLTLTYRSFSFIRKYYEIRDNK